MKTYLSFEATPEHFSTNRALAYGDGLFETILLHNNKMPLWNFHIQRLQAGLKQLGMQHVSERFLLDKIRDLINDQSNGIIKIIVFRESQQHGYAGSSSATQSIIALKPMTNHESLDTLGVSNIRLSRQKYLAGLKHLNRLEQVLAANELLNSGYNDALMLDEKNKVIETISKNIVLIKGNKLYTPKLTKCGVYGVALRWLESIGFELIWKKIEFKSLHKYDVFLVCNSIRGFHAIASINHKFQFNVNALLITEIQKQWHKTIKS